MQWSFRRICVYVDPNIQDVQGAISDDLHLWSRVFLGMVSPPYASSNFSHGQCVADLAPHLFCHVSKRRAHKRTVLEALTSSGTYTSSGRAWWGDFAAWSRELHLACLSTSRKCSAKRHWKSWKNVKCGEKLEVMEEREMFVFHVVVGSDVGLRTAII